MAQPSSNVASLLAAAAAKRPAAEPKAKPATDLVWESIDPATLPPDVAELFYSIGKARSAFEAAVSDLLSPPEHLKLAFAYKRGLAIALAPRTKPNAGWAGLMSRVNAAE